MCQWNITSADQGGFHIQTPTFTVPAAVYAGTEQLQEVGFQSARAWPIDLIESNKAEVVRLLESPTTFSITSAGRNQVNVRLRFYFAIHTLTLVKIGAINEDFLWTVAPKSTLPANVRLSTHCITNGTPFILLLLLYRQVTLNPANGDAGQLWVLVPFSLT